jgi:hypothetical protein
VTEENNFSLSRQRERVGVRVDMILVVSPSLPLCGIPYSLIYEKRSGTVSSPPRERKENL